MFLISVSVKFFSWVTQHLHPPPDFKGLVPYTRAPRLLTVSVISVLWYVSVLAASVAAEAACWSAVRVEGPGGITRLSPAVSPGFRLVPAPLRRWFQSHPAWAALDSSRLLSGALMRPSAAALGPGARSAAVHVEWKAEAARKGTAAPAPVAQLSEAQQRRGAGS